MKELLIVVSIIVLSCSEPEDRIVHSNHNDSVRFDSSYWQVSEIIVNNDTVVPDLDEFLFKIDDTCIHEYEFREGILINNSSGQSYCKTWIEVFDTLVFPITCNNYYFPYVRDEYVLVGDHAEIYKIRVVHSVEDQYELEGKVILERKLIPANASENMIRFFKEFPDSVLLIQ